MPTPDFPVGVPPWSNYEELKGYVGMLSQRLFNLLCNLDSLNVTRLDAGTIQIYDLKGGTGTITLTGDGLTISNGTFDTFSADINGNVTMVSAVIKSQNAYPQVVMNLNSNLIQAFQDANNHIDINPVSGGAPAINWFAAGAFAASLSTSSTVTTLLSAVQLLLQSTGNMTITSSAGGISLNPSTSTSLNGPTVALNPSGSLSINGLIGNSGSLSYLKDVTSDGAGGFNKFYGSITITKGIITGFT